jgi:hypothetical protein
MDDVLSALILEAKRMQAALVSRNPALKDYFVSIPFLNGSEEIPFLPIRCFRQFDIFSGELPKSGALSDVFSFLSSGSTNDVRGKHYFSEAGLQFYAQSSVEGFQRFLERFSFDPRVPVLSLVPPTSIWPRSSLAAMIEMFQKAGFSIQYVDVEHTLNDLKSALSRVGGEAIVFGTSFHHVWVQRLAKKAGIRNLFQGNRLGIIDTGGTKGRTESYSQEEIRGFVEDVYGTGGEVLFLSEYGMCELASQAWSLQSPHNNRFVCNATLIPFAVDATLTRLCKCGEMGFLAFGDAVNSCSYPFLITEDIGAVWESGFEENSERCVFSIDGRAPDASLKGCSLNVRDASVVVSPESHAGVESIFSKAAFFFRRNEPRAFTGDVFKRVCEHLPSNIWTSRSLIDLQKTLAGWNGIPSSSFAVCRNRGRGKVAHVVASANIPITWVLPAAAAAWLGFREFHINMPTLRNNDPYSTIVIERIRSLVEVLSEEFAPMTLRLHTRRMAHPDEFGADVVIVFGSEATCQTFSEMQRFARAKILTFGDVWNSYECLCEQISARDVIEKCVAWRGRGCLTPIVLFWQERLEERKQFSLELARGMSRALKGENDIQNEEFLHMADMCEVRGRMKEQGLSPDRCISHEEGAWVVDLVDAPRPWEFPLKSGGCGLVYLIDAQKKKSAKLEWLGAYDCSPGIHDEHMGKTWFDWLLLHLNS